MKSTKSNGSHEVIILNSDGTYIQTVQCKNGKKWVKTGKWMPAEEDPAWRFLPGVDASIPSVSIQDTYDTSSCCSRRTGIQHTIGMFLPMALFVSPVSTTSATQSAPQMDQETALGWLIFFKMAFLVVWIWGLVDVCSSKFADVNQKISWVVCVVLLGCVGSVIYFAFGRSHRIAPEVVNSEDP